MQWVPNKCKGSQASAMGVQQSNEWTTSAVGVQQQQWVPNKSNGCPTSARDPKQVQWVSIKSHGKGNGGWEGGAPSMCSGHPTSAVGVQQMHWVSSTISGSLAPVCTLLSPSQAPWRPLYSPRIRIRKVCNEPAVKPLKVKLLFIFLRRSIGLLSRAL